MNFSAPDLTQRPPHSPRVRLGGYVILARSLDKCRATLAGTNGEYHFDCPLDRKFFTFVGLDPKAFQREVAKGKGDGEMLPGSRSTRKTSARFTKSPTGPPHRNSTARAASNNARISMTTSTRSSHRTATTSPSGSISTTSMTT